MDFANADPENLVVDERTQRDIFGRSADVDYTGQSAITDKKLKASARVLTTTCFQDEELEAWINNIEDGYR